MKVPSDYTARASWVVFGAMSAQLVMGAVYARGPLAPAIIEDLGWGRGDMMLAGAPAVVMTALASPVAGIMTQRYGARPVVAFGAVLVSLLFWGFSQMQTLWHLFACSMGIGILVASVGDVAVGSVVARWISRGRGLALGIVYTGSNLGGFIAAIAAGFLLEAVGWRQAYLWIGMGFTIVILPTVLLTVREPPAGYVPPSQRFGADGEEIEPVDELGIDLRTALRTPAFWMLFAALFLFYLYFIAVNAHLTLYLTDIGLSPRAVAMGFAMTIGVGVLAKLGIGLVADRWPAKTALLICLTFVSSASVMLLLMRDRPILVPTFLVVHGIAVMAQNVVYPLAVAWCFGTRHMASIYGVMMLALLSGQVGAISAGYMHDALGSYDLAFRLLSGGTFAALLLAALVRPARGAPA